MFTEQIDILRCPAMHEDSWLVAASTHAEGRHIITGTLGCPVCKASYEIVEGEVRFSDAPLHTSSGPMDTELAFELAAQLHLVEAPLPVMLTGGWSRAVAPLRTLVPTVSFLVGDAQCLIRLDDRVSTLRLPLTGIPLATGSIRGLALDAVHASVAFLTAASRAVCTSGRLVLPAGSVLDPSLWRILASDGHVIVAERLPVASALVSLRRAPAKPLFER